ncbi:MAG: alpha-galactosidase [Firmicutes bacterium]|nr:alpha-galactosidase [Bacillota bacterium]
MNKTFFVDVDKSRITSDRELEKNNIKLNIKADSFTGGERYSIELENTGDRELSIGKAGVIFNGVKSAETRQWRIFTDLGMCGWAGVKRIDYTEENIQMGVIWEQKTCDAKEDFIIFHRSDLQTVVWDAASGEAILFGFLRQRKGPNKIDIVPSDDKKNIDHITAWQQIGCELEPGKKICLDTLVIYYGNDPYILLENFAVEVANNHGKKFDFPPVVGMMTWYGYRTAVDEQIVLENAKIISEIFNGYPQKMKTIMLIDHGWQDDANWGYFTHDRRRFPHGLKWLGEQMEKYGVKLGIWHTPFCISRNAANYNSLIDLMVRDDKGEIQQGVACVWGDLPGHSTGNWPINFFDGDNEEVQKRWQQEMSQLKEWGVVYCKMDFFALQTSQNKKKHINIGDLYAKTWESFRKGTGEDMHIAPCSCSTNLQLGYCDSVRIGSDIGNSGHWPGAYEQFRYGLSTVAALWYKNRKFWINDADSIQIAKGCSLSEARVRATVVALSGGHVMLSEDLRTVDNQRLEIIRRILPAYPEAAKPINMFENPFPEGYPSMWSLTLYTDFGRMVVLAVFNLTQKMQIYEITPQMVGMEPGKEFIALEWWQNKWIGRFKDKFTVEVPAEDVAVIHAQPIKDVPTVVSVSHHITGGYIIENVTFDVESGILKAELVTKVGMPMVVFGYVPEGWELERNERSHAIINSLRGWQKEVVTKDERTQFSIKFERVDAQQVDINQA